MLNYVITFLEELDDVDVDETDVVVKFKPDIERGHLLMVAYETEKNVMHKLSIFRLHQVQIILQDIQNTIF